MLKPLEGVKVVDFTVAGSGPSATRLLADYGAEVYMVEALEGVNTRTFFAETDYYDLGKKSLPLNLKSPEGREIIYKLLETADVFVTNFRMKAIAKLGLDFETVHKLNPRLVYATLTGYGYDGPEKDAPGYDFVSYWSEAGLMNCATDYNGTVLVPLTGYGDPVCGKSLTMGICAALYHAALTGEGLEVTTSLLADGVYQNHTPIIERQYGDAWPKTRTEPDSALKNSYKCRDGWFYLAGEEPAHMAGTLRAANLFDLVDDPEWQTLDDARGEKGKKLTAILDKAFADAYVDGAVNALKRMGVPCYKMNSMFEAINDPQANANQYWQPNVQYFDGRTILLQSTPVRFGDNVPNQASPVPQLGENTVEILKSLGYGDEAVESLIRNRVVVAQGR